MYSLCTDEADKAQIKMLIQILHKLATILNFQLPQLIVILSITMHAAQAERWACNLNHYWKCAFFY